MTIRQEARDAVRVDERPSPVADLVWVDEGGWVARDPALTTDDPACIIAFIEHRDGGVHVQWVRGRHDRSTFVTLREAVQEVSAHCAGTTPSRCPSATPGRTKPSAADSPTRG